MASTGRVTINNAGITALTDKMRVAIEKTAEQTVTDLKNSGIIPFDIGTLQGSTYWDRNSAADNEVFIISNTPYARRLYFHPEYNFRTTNNANAGASWFEPYLTGDKKDYIMQIFTMFMSQG